MLERKEKIHRLVEQIFLPFFVIIQPICHYAHLLGVFCSFFKYGNKIDRYKNKLSHNHLNHEQS